MIQSDCTNRLKRLLNLIVTSQKTMLSTHVSHLSITTLLGFWYDTVGLCKQAKKTFESDHFQHWGHCMNQWWNCCSNQAESSKFLKDSQGWDVYNNWQQCISAVNKSMKGKKIWCRLLQHKLLLFLMALYGLRAYLYAKIVSPLPLQYFMLGKFIHISLSQ